MPSLRYTRADAKDEKNLRGLRPPATKASYGSRANQLLSHSPALFHPCTTELNQLCGNPGNPFGDYGPSQGNS